MKIKFTRHAAKDVAYWKMRDKKVYGRIKELVEAIAEEPFSGIGKPEPLKHNYTGKWSRRITREHRLVYEIVDNHVVIYQCHFHY